MSAAKKIAHTVVKLWNKENLTELEKFITNAIIRYGNEQREKLAHWMLNKRFSTGHGDTIEELLKELDYNLVRYGNQRVEECALIHDQINPASDSERSKNLPGCDAMGSIIEYRDKIRSLKQSEGE